MIGRWLDRRRDRAHLAWHHARRMVRLGYQEHDAVARARRRVARWDAALEWWNAGRH